MTFRIGRTLPPAAAPLLFSDIISGVAGFFCGVDRVSRYEEEIKRSYRVRHCFAVSSGKAALVLTLRALHELFPERDEVLIPAYTCYSVPSAIVRAGLKVRLCDLGPESLDFDFERLARLLDNPHLLCVIPTHLFGMPADVEQVKRLVVDRGIFVVEDAAQAMGAEWKGKKLGTLGDVGFFSTGRGKALSTVEGGVILTDNDQIGRSIEKCMCALPKHGILNCLKLLLYAVALALLIHPWIYWLPKSLPFLKIGETRFDTSFPIERLSAFQAGLADGWENKIEESRDVRRGNVGKIVARGITLFGNFEGLPDLIRFPILCADADAKRAILEKSEKLGLGIADGYPDSLDGISGLAVFTDGYRLQRAKDIAVRVVCLPIHPFVSDGDIRKIAKLFEKKRE